MKKHSITTDTNYHNVPNFYYSSGEWEKYSTNYTVQLSKGA